MTLQNGTHGTDGQTDGQTDRVRRNMQPPPREEGRIIIMSSNSGQSLRGAAKVQYLTILFPYSQISPLA